RERHEDRMRDRALNLQRAGQEINGARIHWFLPDPEGFTEAAELRWVSPQGVGRCDYHETRCAWTLLCDVVVDEHHVFLIRAEEIAWILPKRCFIDAKAVARFLDAVRERRQAAFHAPKDVIDPSPETRDSVSISP